ncbi:MAG TPA: aldehyde ferredoxin oxidoreductase [Gammaproteobacteria bacterium]|nr:aldehyde ferredoxin oxidoreductase [Gammaproteobacteria bacterium]
MAWQGRLLRVNLSAGSWHREALNIDWARKYLGQRGLATRYLFADSNPAADPLSADNHLIFATGPLTGTSASTAGRYSVVTKGALTGAIACSNSGGHFGAELKNAGWDMIVFEGISPKPVYLYLCNDEVALLDASAYWGKTVWETEPALQAKHQDPRIRVAAIGQAGEIGVRYACIINDLDRAAGRSGVGAVMGSKKLKAIAVRGTCGVGVKNPQQFMRLATVSNQQINDSRSARRQRENGTMAMMDVTQAYGALPTRNNQQVQFEGVGKINVAAMKRNRYSDGKPNLKGNKACFACHIACGRVARIDPQHFSVVEHPERARISGGLEYESGFSLGAMLGVDDVEAATYANFVCNEQGMDPISFGGTLAAAMELFEAGVIDRSHTDGYELRFGSAEILVKMIELTGRGEGFGIELGLGSKRLCEKYGHPEMSMAVKGQEIPGYDGRAMQGMALAYATSNRGACHLRADPFRDDFSRVTSDGKAQIVASSQNDNSVIDSSGLCQFPGYSLATLSDLMAADSDGDYSLQNLQIMGERIWNLERQFNLAAGLTRADDTVPTRMLVVPACSGAGEGKVAELEKMLPEYYQLRGWDAEGVPTTATLQRLGLTDL